MIALLRDLDNFRNFQFQDQRLELRALVSTITVGKFLDDPQLQIQWVPASKRTVTEEFG